MSYITLTEAKAYLGITGTDEDACIMALIGAAQQAIESYCVRRFAAQSYETKLFDQTAIDGRRLHLGQDAVRIVEVVSDGRVVQGYTTLPLSQKPYYALELAHDSPLQWVAPVAVQGLWAYSAAPPEDIKHAVRQLVSALYTQQDGQAAMSDLPPFVKTILNRYRRMI
jgi:uncharacterized phiE125 gp8 family phage protein